VAHNVVFAPEAEADLIALHGGPERALGYVERIVATCRSLSAFPARGARRDDIRPGLRVTSMARRVTIAYHLAGEVVTIDRILYGGRDLGAAFANK
jgi:toxin ParE1/3/4